MRQELEQGCQALPAETVLVNAAIAAQDAPVECSQRFHAKSEVVAWKMHLETMARAVCDKSWKEKQELAADLLDEQRTSGV